MTLIAEKDLKAALKKAFLSGLKEDFGNKEKQNDITTQAIFQASHSIPLVLANILAKEKFIVCGTPLLKIAFPEKNAVRIFKQEGEQVNSGEVIASITARADTILCRERTALNILQRLSGIATKTFQLRGLLSKKISLLDTRKTTPGLRLLEKYAVATGGGENHRMNLFEQYMIKDNHLLCLPSKSEDFLLSIVKRVGEDRKHFFEKTKKKKLITVECENQEELSQILIALKKGYLERDDVVMLDNMDEANLIEAIKKINGLLKVEVSGGINEKSIAMLNKLVQQGLVIDRVSSGLMTHHLQAVDMSLEIEKTQDKEQTQEQGTKKTF